MRKLPKIGQRVSHPGREGCGAFTGVVYAIYPKYHRPETEWHVGIVVDTLPQPWPFPGENKIAPSVADLKAIRR